MVFVLSDPYLLLSGLKSIFNKWLHLENVQPPNAVHLHSWSAGARQEIHLRYPELARVSDSTFAFDDPSNALYVCNVGSDSVTDTGLRGFRPMSFRTATNQLICSDVRYEYLYLVDLKKNIFCCLVLRDTCSSPRGSPDEVARIVSSSKYSMSSSV